ncbi:MAG: hypothetical protein SPF69_10095 [Candidatus Ornithospirochaeta sp.]|nr:hypothetical protein [Sphaerochaetaceae bacterium]MDY5524413.1 hypothetical protein [Candidatus Ornithospirochaeta sp.]
MSLKPFTVTSTHGEVKASFAGRMFYSAIKKNMMKQFSGGSGDNGDEFTKIIDAMLEDMPLRQLAMLSGDAVIPNVMEGLVEMMNGHYIRGLKMMKS